MGSKALRIAYARLFHEANVYSPLPTTRADFERVQLIRGSALTERVRRDRWEIPGLIPWGELSGFEEAARRASAVERLPLLSAMAIPSGKLTAAAYAELRDELTAGLEEVAPVDGVYLALHGSMRVAGMSGAPEADLLRAVRRVLGPAARIAISLDLHANLSAEIVAAADVIQSFRANPHWDLAPTGYRATRTLIGMLRGDVQPVTAWRKLPIVLGGGAGISFLTPARSVFRRMKRMARDRRVLNVSFNMVHPFSDADDLGWTTHVITNGDRDLAERLADELADAAWAIRRHPLPTFHSLEEALELVRHKSRLHGGLPSSLIDLGDNVLSGTSGGTNHLLGALLERAPNIRVYVPIHDPGLVEAARQRAGEKVRLSSVGTPALGQEPVPIEGRVAHVHEAAGATRVHFDLGDVQLVATETPPHSHHPRFYRELGLEPRAADAIVQKSFFQYRILYLGTSHHHIPVTAPGPSDLHAASHRAFPHPVYPKDDPADWREFDRIQRGP